MTNESDNRGPLNPYGDLSRRAIRELEARGINPADAMATYNETGDIQALTGSIPIIQPGLVPSQPPVAPPTLAPVVPPPVAAPVAVPAPPVAPLPPVAPVVAQSIFPETISGRDERILEERRTAEIPTSPSESSVPDPQLEESNRVAEPVIVTTEPQEDQAAVVRIDVRDDHQAVTNEFEPFTITTTSTGVVPTTGHALILPTLPEEAPELIAALNQTGEIVVTGQITLPAGIASVGAETASLDTTDIDLSPDSEVVTSSQDLAPVSAAQAVSSFSGTTVTVTAPRRSSERLPVVLAIAAAVLAVGVVGLFVANFFLHVF